MAVVTETFGYKFMNASGVLNTTPALLGGFCCSVTGTLKLAETVGGGIVQDTTPVTAGVFLPLPYGLGTGVTVTLAAGAQGTFAIL